MAKKTKSGTDIEQVKNKMQANMVLSLQVKQTLRK